jgi:hypothetical protein
MSTATLNALMQQIRVMPLEEQRALNSLLVANIRASLKSSAIMTSINYGHGDIVKFEAGIKGTIFIEVTGFSRDRTKIKGTQIGQSKFARRKVMNGTNWTAGANIVKASSKDEAAKA